MIKFFESIERLDYFTLNLKSLPHDIVCQHCHKNQYFISHGFVYKQRHQGVLQPVGKRIFCSNRNGHLGCGRTYQLYIATEIPALKYSTLQLFTFITLLLADIAVNIAYSKATGAADARNAWRWVTKLYEKLIEFKALLYKPVVQKLSFVCHRSRRLNILLPTLWRIVTISFMSSHAYQLCTHKPFI